MAPTGGAIDISLSLRITIRRVFSSLIVRLPALFMACLLYTSDAADERSSVDLGGRRIIKKKKNREEGGRGRMIKKIVY